MSNPTISLVNYATRAVIEAITNGCTLHAITTSVDIVLAAPGAARVQFQFDGRPVPAEQRWAVPFCVSKFAPLNLSAGSHTLAYATSTSLTAPFGPMTTVSFTVTGQSATHQMQVGSTGTIYYVSNAGSDSNPGTQPLPWKTPRAVSNATVVLAAGEIFGMGSPLQFINLTSAIVTTDSTNPATIQGLNADVQKDMTSWNGSVNCTLENLIIDSDNGNGFAGNVRGIGPAIVNIQLKNLGEGFDWQNTNGVVIIGGQQIGKVAGRCHYFVGCSNFNVSGGLFGPGRIQSPIRFSTFVDTAGVNHNNNGGSITGFTVTQAGSTNDIASWAIHNLVNVAVTDCSAIQGEFSFDGAGDALGDIVQGVTVTNLTTTETKVDLRAIAFNNKFVGGNFQNSTGECVSIQTAAKAGNVIDGATMKSPKHACHFYCLNDTLIENVSFNQMGNASAPLMDGACVAANAGAGNVIKPS